MQTKYVDSTQVFQNFTEIYRSGMKLYILYCSLVNGSSIYFYTFLYETFLLHYMQHSHYKFLVCFIQPLRDSVITEIHDKLKRNSRQLHGKAFVTTQGVAAVQCT